MRTPSPATVIATLALVVATTGTGIAATKINGKDIKNYSITENKLAKNSVSGRAIRPASITTTDLADGVIVNNTINAPAGPKGEPGAAGAPGVAIVDPSRIVSAVGQDVITHSASSAGSEAICPAGTYVIGGGNSNLGSFVNAPVSVIESAIATDGSNGWYVQTHNYGGSDQAAPWHAIAYCAPAA